MATHTYRRSVHRRSRSNRRWIWVWGGAGLLVLIQLLYPGSWIPPLTRLDGTQVSGKSEADIKAMVASDTYSQASLKVDIEGSAKRASATVTAHEAGLQPDAATTYDALRSYPFWQRLIPLSFVAHGVLTDHSVQVISAEKVFDEFVKSQVQACGVAAKDASVAVKNGKASLVSARDGQTCEASMVRERLLKVGLKHEGSTVKFSAKKVAPTISDRHAESAVRDAQKRIDQDIKLSVAGTTHSLDPATIGSFLSFAPDAKDEKKLAIDLDSEVVRSYLATIEEKMYKAPTAKSEGRALNYSATKTALYKQIFEKGDGTVGVVTVSIPAGTAAHKLYAASVTGLQELLDDIVTAKGRYGISVRMLDGTVTSSRGDVQYHPASTYKLYVAYGLLKGIEKGKYHWSDQATGGLTISQCFDKMIINSDNDCAVWFGNTVGWANINSEMRAIGLEHTSTLYGQQRSTANDETLFLTKLQNGDLLQETERDRLLGVMKRQVYRSGIPAGLKGATVADKVGFLDADLHDSALVYADKQTYALTILTTGSSWAGIADAAAQIQLQLDRM